MVLCCSWLVFGVVVVGGPASVVVSGPAAAKLGKV